MQQNFGVIEGKIKRTWDNGGFGLQFESGWLPKEDGQFLKSLSSIIGLPKAKGQLKKLKNGDSS